MRLDDESRALVESMPDKGLDLPLHGAERQQADADDRRLGCKRPRRQHRHSGAGDERAP